MNFGPFGHRQVSIFFVPKLQSFGLLARWVDPISCNTCGFDLEKEKRKNWVISDSRLCPFLKWSISIARSLSASPLINHLPWRIQFVLRISVRNLGKSIIFRRIGEPLVLHRQRHRIPFRFLLVIDLDRPWLML